MIEAAAVTWPESAFWLATGIEDMHHGHIDPTREYDPVSERTAAKPYFKKLLEIQRKKREASGDSEAWSAQLGQLEAQKNALIAIRAQQEKTLADLDINEQVAF